MNKRNNSVLELVKNSMFFSNSRKFFVVLFTAVSGFIYAQQIVNGTVRSQSNGKPLANATVKIATSDETAISDANGNFSITASPQDTIVITSPDFVQQEIQVGNQTSFSVSLSKERVQNIDEVVLIGYGTQKKSDITGAVSVVKMADVKKTVTYDPAKLLQGQAAGVTVQSSGEPGGYVNIKIRGITSFSNNNPLFVVDGVIVNSPNDFAPGDIESMQVLKDASAAAIYGVRGANGVVIIQTKQGKKGRMNLSYRSVNGFQNVPRTIDVVDRIGYQNITNQAYINAGLDILPGNNPNNPYFIDNVDTDWQKAAFRTGTIQNHTVNIGGGADNLNYNLNLDYFKNTAYMTTPQDFERYTMNFNFGGKYGKRFTYGGKISYTQSDKESFTAYDNGSALIYLLQAIPTMPVYDNTRLGGYGGTNFDTQAAISLNIIGYNNLNQSTAVRNRFLTSIWGEYEILKNLKYKLNVSYDRLNVHSRAYTPQSDLGWYYITKADEAQLDIADNFLETTFINNLLTYKFDLGLHNFDFLAGWIQQKDSYYNHWSRGVGYSAGTIPQIEYATKRDSGEYQNKVNTLSYIGRMNYNFADKYLVTANFRQDKSSLFAPRNNHGEYFSFSAGWRLDREEFLNLPEYIKLLKIRGGWGRLGNNTIGVYAWENTINPFASYIFGGALQQGSTVTTIKDQDIKWETTETSNIALELNIANKFDFTVEYYTKSSKDLLANVPIPYSSGGYPNTITTNAADIRNKGLEFSAAYNLRKEKFSLNINGNVGVALENRVLRIGDDNNPIFGVNSKTEVGRSVGELYGWIAEGIFQNTADIQSHATQVNAQPGDVKFKDLNGDGVIDDNDRTYLGGSIPKLTYGLNVSATYGNFDFSMFWQGQAGNYIYNGTYSALMIGQLVNHSTDMLNYWTPENTNTNIPRPVMNDANANNRASNRFVQKGDFLKLQTLELGYSIPVNTDYINKVRVFVSGQNLWTLTAFTGYDPDFISDGLFSRGFEYGSFPNARTISVGFDVNF